MSDFFIGWRRKCGCVTLATAVLLTLACFRSQASCDRVTICPTDKMYSFGSCDSHIVWRKEFDPPPTGGSRVWWGTNHFGTALNLEIRSKEQLPPDFSLSYWILISPLTIASCCLLLPSKKHGN